MSRSNSRHSSKYKSRESRLSDTYGGTISDIDLIDKLTQDKAKLKEKLRKLVNELDKREEKYKKQLRDAETHCKELKAVDQQNSDYEYKLNQLNMQITDLTTQLRKYQTNASKRETQELKKLSQELKTTQELLEQEKANFEQAFKQLENKWREQCKNLYIELENERSQHSQEREANARIITNFKNVEEKMKKMNVEEKEREISNIKQQVSTDLKTFRDHIQSLEEQNKEQRDTYNQDIKDLEEKHEKLYRKYSDTILSLEKKNTTELNNLHAEYRQQLSLKDKTHTEQLNNIDIKHTKEIEELNHSYLINFTKQKNLYEDKITKLEKENLALQEKNNYNKEQIKTMILNREAELSDEYNTKLSLVESKCNATLDIKNREISNIISNRDNLLDKAEKEKSKLAQEIVDITSELADKEEQYKKLEIEYKKYNKKQLQMFNDEINKRDSSINILQTNLKKLGLESVQKLANLDNKIKELTHARDQAEILKNCVEAQFKDSSAKTERLREELQLLKEKYITLQCKSERELFSCKQDSDYNLQKLHEANKLLQDCKTQLAEVNANCYAKDTCIKDLRETISFLEKYAPTAKALIDKKSQ